MSPLSPALRHEAPPRTPRTPGTPRSGGAIAGGVARTELDAEGFGAGRVAQLLLPLLGAVVSPFPKHVVELSRFCGKVVGRLPINQSMGVGEGWEKGERRVGGGWGHGIKGVKRCPCRPISN